MALINGSRGVVSKARPVKEVIEELTELLKTQLAQPMSEDEEWKRAMIEQQIHLLRSYTVKWVPVVRFVNGVEQTMIPDLFRAELSGTGVSRRWQIPLKLAWALTIHKCQGLTLDRARISLREIFASGHGTFLILSRFVKKRRRRFFTKRERIRNF